MLCPALINHRQYPYGLRFPLIVKDTLTEPETYVYGVIPEKDITIDISDTYYTQEQKDVDADYLGAKCDKGIEPPPSGVVHRDYDGTDGPNTIYAGGPSGRLRIRLINMSAYSTMLVFLNNGGTNDGVAEGIPFYVSEVDSVPLDRNYMPIATAIELNAGRRMSIIVDLDNDLGSNKAGFNVITTLSKLSPVLTDFANIPRSKTFRYNQMCPVKEGQLRIHCQELYSLHGW